jgi:2',3'-cyclic-nucleotide 2'-phosphodiesterase (5'-nucleotidase family)
VRAGILGITDPDLASAAAGSRVLVEEPAATVRRLAAQCRRQGARLLIVLFHGPDAKARELARQSPEVDLILFGHQGWIVPPEKVGGALIASPGELGNRIGVLTLQLGPDGVTVVEHRLHAFSYAKDPDDPAVRQRVRAYRKKLQERLRRED